jgi:hypothetical protein
MEGIHQLQEINIHVGTKLENNSIQLRGQTNKNCAQKFRTIILNFPTN